MSTVEKSFYGLNLIQVLVLLRTLGYKGESVVVWFEEFVDYKSEEFDFDLEYNKYYDGEERAIVQVRYENNAVFLVHVFELG